MSQAAPKVSKTLTTSPIHYEVVPSDLNARLFTVTLTIHQPRSDQEVSLPVWIPGSYLVREFSKNLQQLRSSQGGREVAIRQLDKNRWQVACNPKKPLVLTYAICAYDHSVRTAWLDQSRGFFNGTSICLRVHGEETRAHSLTVSATDAIAGWSVATGLQPIDVNANGFGLYRAADYDELVDCPVEMGLFWSGKFKAGGVTHQFVVAGAAPSFDGQRLLDDTRKICETVIHFWHGKQKPPLKRYVFMLNAVSDGYGGLEHRNSTALICNRRDLPRCGDAKTGDGYTTLLGLISHEYFHTWNVKRLRPQEFASYNYAQENYTELLWFFEGFTSYYDDLLLRRAGLIDDATYLKLIGKTINQVQQTPGRAIQSVAQASFDAWVKYYRQDEYTPNVTVSYYTKGSLVGLCLDLTLRQEGRTTLDDVMRALWKRCAGGPMQEADLHAVLRDLGGRSFEQEIASWVHSTQDLPLEGLLKAHGITLRAEPAQLAQRLGLRVHESHSVMVKTVLRGGVAEAAGMAPGDEWLAVSVAGQEWRVNKLDDVVFYAGAQRELTAIVSRDARLIRLPLQIPGLFPLSESIKKRHRSNPSAVTPPSAALPDTFGLVAVDSARIQRWLDRQIPA